MIGVREAHPQGHHAGRRLDPRLGGFKLALDRIGGAIGQDQPGLAERPHRPALGGRGQAQDVGRRLRHVDIDRVKRPDRRQGGGLLGGHQRAGRGLRQPDHPGDGRADRGPVKLDRGALQLRLGRLHLGIGRRPLRHRGIAVLRRARARGKKLDRAFFFQHRQIARGFRLRHRGFRRGHGGLIAVILDLVERLALGHDRALLEQPPAQDARDLRAHLRLGRGLDPAGQTRVQRQILRMGDDGGDGGRALRALLRNGGQWQEQGDQPQSFRKRHGIPVRKREGQRIPPAAAMLRVMKSTARCRSAVAWLCCAAR